MNEIPARQVKINDPFWSSRLGVNASVAIFHQWQQLEKSGCIDNFRILTGQKQGFREGWFFADSDAFKWLDAAARIYDTQPDPALKGLMDGFIDLVAHAQAPDGYIYTYNQIHFPGCRWVNLQIEHELYCHGHLIEAAVSHFNATGERSALEIAIKAAELLVHDFLNAPPQKTDGHQEIEIALIKLYKVTGDLRYLNLAQHFIEARGRIPQYALLIFRENSSREQREAVVRRERDKYAAQHPEYAISKVPPNNEAKKPPLAEIRWKLNALTGKYSQQHVPFRSQTVPVGHSVRFGYFQTAAAMLYRQSGDGSLLPPLQQSWERMVTRRMYVTGGLGSLPGSEGFGNDYELDPRFAYAETCAALAGMFWNWEMALATREAKYSDLFEWQLYNAASVGMGLGGITYLYNNPLAVEGGITRKPWYSVPCCPSNLSRTWADLGRYIYSYENGHLWIHQYIGSEITPQRDAVPGLCLESGLPFNGSVTIRPNLPIPKHFSLHLRVPSWSKKPEFRINGEVYKVNLVSKKFEQTAQGYDPRLSDYQSIERLWQPGDMLEIIFDMPVELRCAHPKVKGHAGKLAITRGPLVYCLESPDNPNVDIFTTRLDPVTLRTEDSDQLGGITLLRAGSDDGQPLTFIPYALWGNRGESQMNVWIDTK